MPVSINLDEGIACPWRPVTHTHTAPSLRPTLGVAYVAKEKASYLRMVSVNKPKAEWMITGSPSPNPEMIIAWYDDTAPVCFEAVYRAMQPLHDIISVGAQDPYESFCNAYRYWKGKHLKGMKPLLDIVTGKFVNV